jgi:hypothetical protein
MAADDRRHDLHRGRSGAGLVRAGLVTGHSYDEHAYVAEGSWEVQKLAED